MFLLMSWAFILNLKFPRTKAKDLISQRGKFIPNLETLSGEVAQWLAPQISSANREVGGSSPTVSTDDLLG